MKVGQEGPAVLISARTAAFLERYAGLPALRVRARGPMPEIAAELTEIRETARLYRPLPGLAEAEAGSAEEATESWLTPVQVADMAGVSDRAVRLACDEGRLVGDRSTGRWRISESDAHDFISRRTTRRSA